MYGHEEQRGLAVMDAKKTQRKESNNKIDGAASNHVVVRVAARSVAAGRVTRVGSFQVIGCGVGCFAIRTRPHGER